MFEPKKDQTPEPGKYEFPTYIGEGPKYTMRELYNVDGTKKEKRHKKAYRKKSNPGPGTYNIEDKSTGPRYTFRARYKRRSNKRPKTPAVGSYELRNDKSLQVPTFRFDKELRTNGNINTGALKFPGPGTYNINAFGMSTTSPKYSFSKSQRIDIKRPMTPGPGAYSHRSYIGKEGPHLSFGRDKNAHYEPNKNTNPEPGRYFKNIAYVPDSSKYSFPKSNRPEPGQNKERLNSPGPEKYNPNAFVSSTRKSFPSWRVGTSNRDEIANKNKFPGPGTYSIKNGLLPEGAKYTISKRLNGSKKPDYPGPCKYDIVTVHHPNEPKYSIGKEQRPDETKQTIKDNYPAPDKYKIQDVSMTRPISFPKGKKETSNKTFTPGPGSYKIPCRFNDINDLTREKGIWDPTFRYV